MSGPNYDAMINNKKANVRIRVAQEGPIDVVKKLLTDSNKRVRRTAEARLKEGARE
jgi:hypothetical protein